MLDEGQLEMGHARALLALSGDTQVQAARQIINKGLSVRETERLIKQIKNQGGQETKKAERSPDVLGWKVASLINWVHRCRSVITALARVRL